MEDSGVIIWVSGSFTASHVCAEAEPHSHKWDVKAWFSVAPRTDMRCYRAALDALLASWEGTLLPPEREWSEDIAKAIYTLVNCVRVEVDREDERMGAVWPPELAA